ncbi:PREDICTED: regulator of G-protein signaling 3-like [Priapulus caudatus]|uniref:Regulator of G-protein signaling 3-like n=1 Tax=Priapulus caudatus TaxID=37621 RepID=A0ABM1EKE0_PRICU|nr:PREDICTED: regulator of G-protein signaling 3-like [Priapulus caudatus]
MMNASRFSSRKGAGKLPEAERSDEQKEATKEGGKRHTLPFSFARKFSLKSPGEKWGNRKAHAATGLVPEKSEKPYEPLSSSQQPGRLSPQPAGRQSSPQAGSRLSPQIAHRHSPNKLSPKRSFHGWAQRNRERLSPTTTPTSTSTMTTPDESSEVESIHTSHSYNALAVAPPAESTAAKQEKHKSPGRLRRLLRRSHSTAGPSDAPAYALFLNHEREKQGIHKKFSMPTSSSIFRHDDDANAELPTDESSLSAKNKKSLTKDIKSKFKALRRRHTVSALHGSSGRPQGEKSVRPTQATALSWADRFDTLLHDKYGLSLFMAFLKSEFSEENLEFWIACEEFSHLRPGKLNSRAKKIYADYVAIQAPREVNLDSKTRIATISALATPTPSTFDPAQHRIQGLMEKDSYGRFLKSPLYLELIKDSKDSQGETP